MKTKGIWEVYLPLNFCVGNNFKGSKLNLRSFIIDNASCDLLINDKGIIDRIRVILEEDYQDEYIPSYEHMEYLTLFIEKMEHRVKNIIQRFLDGFSYYTNSIYYKIFDSSGLSTKHKFQIIPDICKGSSEDHTIDCNNLDDNDLALSISYAKKEKDNLDYAWEYYREAEDFIFSGRYEMAIINMAILLEFLIKITLSSYLDENGRFISSSHQADVKRLYGQNGYPSFVNKYYKYGLRLITDKLNDEQTFKAINIIYTTRDKLAHGKKLKDIEFFCNIDEYLIERYLLDLCSYCASLYNFFLDINSEYQAPGQLNIGI